LTAKSSDSSSDDISRKYHTSEILAKFIDGLSIPSFVINRQHKVTHWNTALEALSGLKKEDIQGTDNHWRSFYQQKRPTMADLIIDGVGEKAIESYYRQKCRQSTLIDGAYEVEDFFPEIGTNGKWVRITASPIKDSEGAIIGVIETLEDVTQRRVAEENLRYYLKEVTRAQEEERKRIARDLHDDTVQLLGSLSRQLDTFLRKKHNLKPEDIKFLNDILTQLNTGAKNVHRFSQELRLSVLDDLGLIPALRSLVKALYNEHGIKAELKVVGEAKRYPPEVETTFFRITQEAVNNIGKHSQATEAFVCIEFAGEKTNLTISDNGKGFNLAESINALPRSGKLGLAGIQERAHLLGGTIQVTSSPDNGTCLTVEIPVE